MNALFAAAADVQAFCAARGWRSTLIGGLAVQRWGEPRQTRDVDLALLAGLGGEERFIDPLLERYRPRLPDARDFALARRVVLVETDAGVPLDIVLAALPFETRIVERSTAFRVEDIELTTCSAEDLVVLKAFAGRVQDWLDVEGIIVRQGAALDRDRVIEELRPLLALTEEDAAAEQTLRALFEKHADAWIEVNGARIEKKFLDENVREAMSYAWTSFPANELSEHRHCMICSVPIGGDSGPSVQAYRSPAGYICAHCYVHFLS